MATPRLGGVHKWLGWHGHHPKITGVAVERRGVTDFTTREFGWRRSAQNAASALGSTDGRWAVVSTSVTALIAGSIAWLAAGTMPPTTSHGFEAGRNPSLLPYELFMRLSAKAQQGAYASLGPTVPLTEHRSGSAIVSLENAFADESAGDDSDDTTRGIDTRTITMEQGGTLAGALTDAGVPGADASAVVEALTKVYNPKLLRPGQS